MYKILERTLACVVSPQKINYMLQFSCGKEIVCGLTFLILVACFILADPKEVPITELTILLGF